MNLSILRKFMPTKASLAGAGEALVDFSEREEKRGKTMATQQFIAAFQRAQSSGDKGEIDRVLSDPSFLDADPVVRMRAMGGHQQQLRSDASRDLQARRLEAQADASANKVFSDAAEWGAKGYIADVNLGEYRDDPTRTDELPEQVTFTGEGVSTPIGQLSYNALSKQPRITSIRPGPSIKMKREADAAYARARADEKTREVDDLLARTDTDTRHLRAMARKGHTYLKLLRPETLERLAPSMIEMGISTDAPRRMPMGFVKQVAEYNSAMAELVALQQTLDKFGGTSIETGLWSWIPGTNAQMALSDINKARQRIGKTLEGGVLRKEDEEKYKKILPTVFDMKNVSEFKIESMMATLQRDKDILIATWKELGAGVEGDERMDEDIILQRAENLGLIPVGVGR